MRFCRPQHRDLGLLLVPKPHKIVEVTKDKIEMESEVAEM